MKDGTLIITDLFVRHAQEKSSNRRSGVLSAEFREYLNGLFVIVCLVFPDRLL